MTPADLQSLLDSPTFAPYVRQPCACANSRPTACSSTLPSTPPPRRQCRLRPDPAADTAMVLAVTAKLGAFRPMTTVQLSTSFLRPIAGDAAEAGISACVLRLGKSLVFGELEITDASGRLAAHATTAYALL